MTRTRTRTRLLALLGAAVALLVLGAACFENSVDDESAYPPSISVSGTGEVQAEPDIVTVSTGVEVSADSVAEARAGAAEAAAAVIAALRENGVEERDIRTINVFIYPVYDYRDETPRVTGYTVLNSVEVTVRDVEGVGELIDAVAVAGGDAVRFNGISFAHEDPVGLTRQARELAMADARAKAEQLAELNGVTLGEPLSIVETSWAAPRVGSAPRAEFAAADMAGTSIQPGATGVTVTVQVVWAIEELEE